MQFRYCDRDVKTETWEVHQLTLLQASHFFPQMHFKAPKKHEVKIENKICAGF